MGTEVRIGIFTGLLIVVVAGVYFFYGSNRDAEDLRIVSTATPADAPKIPAGRESKPSVAARRTPSTTVPEPRTTAQRPPARPVSTPVVASKPPASTPQTTAGRSTPAKPDSGALGENTPIRPEVSPHTLLRTQPSNTLVDATRRNLEGAGADPTKQTATPTPVPNATGVKSPTQAQVPPTAIQLPPSLQPAGQKPLQTATKSPGASEPISNSTPGAPVQPPTVKPQTAVIVPPAPQAEPWPRQHTIVSGDMLSTISSKYYGTQNQVSRILKANPNLDPKRLKIGDVVTIPAPDVVLTASGDAGRSNPAVTPSKPSTARTVSAVTAANSAPTTAGPSRTYVVREGDTLYSIAQRMLGDSRKWKSILTNNRAVLKNDPKRLKTGMVLTLPS